MTDGIANNLEAVKAAIAQAARTGGHPRARLVAVSKGQTAAAIRIALKAGHRIFGENRVQEAEEKWPALKHQYPEVELHLIGPLQSNKVRSAVALFDVIETIDRPKIARTIKAEIAASGKTPKLLIQVNTGEEVQKAGVAPDHLADLLKECRALGLDIAGLMCIPPLDEEPALHFALLKKLAQRFKLKELSMGMSGDFETAAALGATSVRVGTAIFGPRA